MSLMLPIGIKLKKYYNTVNITGQIQSNIEKELNQFYKRNTPLNEHSFDGKSLKNENNNDKHDNHDKNKTKKRIKIHN